MLTNYTKFKNENGPARSRLCVVRAEVVESSGRLPLLCSSCTRRRAKRGLCI